MCLTIDKSYRSTNIEKTPIIPIIMEENRHYKGLVVKKLQGERYRIAFDPPVSVPSPNGNGDILVDQLGIKRNRLEKIYAPAELLEDEDLINNQEHRIPVPYEIIEGVAMLKWKKEQNDRSAETLIQPTNPDDSGEFTDDDISNFLSLE